MTNVELFNALLAVASIVLTIYFGMRHRGYSHAAVQKATSTRRQSLYPILPAKAGNHRVRQPTS